MSARSPHRSASILLTLVACSSMSAAMPSFLNAGLTSWQRGFFCIFSDAYCSDDAAPKDNAPDTRPVEETPAVTEEQFPPAETPAVDIPVQFPPTDWTPSYEDIPSTESTLPSTDWSLSDEDIPSTHRAPYQDPSPMTDEARTQDWFIEETPTQDWSIEETPLQQTPRWNDSRFHGTPDDGTDAQEQTLHQPSFYGIPMEPESPESSTQAESVVINEETIYQYETWQSFFSGFMELLQSEPESDAHQAQGVNEKGQESGGEEGEDMGPRRRFTCGNEKCEAPFERHETCPADCPLDDGPSCTPGEIVIQETLYYSQMSYAFHALAIGRELYPQFNISGTTNTVMQLPDGTMSAPFTLPQRGVGEIVTDDSGNIWYAGTFGSNSIVKLDGTGVVHVYPLPPLADVRHLSWGGGNLWFTMGNFKLGSMSPNGQVTEYPVPMQSLGIGLIAAGADGSAWFTQLGQTSVSNKIGRRTPQGSFQEYPIDNIPTSMVVGADGNLWFADYAYGSIGRLTPWGEVKRFVTPSAFQQGVPLEIVSGPDGNVWFTEPYAGKIGRVTMDGTITEFTIPTKGARPRDIFVSPSGIHFTETEVGKVGRISLCGSAGPWCGDNKCEGNEPMNCSVDCGTGVPPPEGQQTYTGGQGQHPAPPEQGCSGDECEPSTPPEESPPPEPLCTEEPKIKEFAFPSAEQCAWPGDIEQASDGSLWVECGSTDPTGKPFSFIWRVAPDGSSFHAFPTKPLTHTPNALAIRSNGEVWISQFWGNVVVLNSNGELLREIPIPNVVDQYPIPANISHPVDIMEGPDGTMWLLLYRQAGTVITLNVLRIADGDVLLPQIVVTGSATTVTTARQAMTIGPDNNVWINIGKAIAKVGVDGSVVAYPAPHPLSYPAPITNGPDGRLWYMGNDVIGAITLGGVITEYPPKEKAAVLGIAAGDDGHIWLTQAIDWTVRMTTGGEQERFRVPDGGWPRSMARGMNGMLYYSKETKKNHGRIGRIMTCASSNYESEE